MSDNQKTNPNPKPNEQPRKPLHEEKGRTVPTPPRINPNNNPKK